MKKQGGLFMVENISLQFVEAINEHNVKRIIELMTEDHEFIDTWNRKESKKEMIKGWENYFEWFPDYHIEILEYFKSNISIGLLGFASGSYKGDKTLYWKIPAFWKIIVEKEKVKLWQVIADSKIPFDSMNVSS